MTPSQRVITEAAIREGWRQAPRDPLEPCWRAYHRERDVVHVQYTVRGAFFTAGCPSRRLTSVAQVVAYMTGGPAAARTQATAERERKAR